MLEDDQQYFQMDTTITPNAPLDHHKITIDSTTFCRMGKSFFLHSDNWTCYRRNYFSETCSYTLRSSMEPRMAQQEAHLLNTSLDQYATDLVAKYLFLANTTQSDPLYESTSETFDLEPPEQLPPTRESISPVGKYWTKSSSKQQPPSLLERYTGAV